MLADREARPGSAGQPSEARAFIEVAVKLEPENPVAHDLLFPAYRCAGRPQDADKKLLTYRQTTDQARKTLQEIQSAILGRRTAAQMAEPPE